MVKSLQVFLEFLGLGVPSPDRDAWRNEGGVSGWMGGWVDRKDMGGWVERMVGDAGGWVGG